MEKVEVAVEELRESALSEDGSSVILETEATVDGELRDTSIEVRQEDLPAVAVALLNTDGGIALGEDASLPAIQCLGVGVVHGLGDGRVRCHLQFDSGQVLPIEMSRDAADRCHTHPGQFVDLPVRDAFDQGCDHPPAVGHGLQLGRGAQIGQERSQVVDVSHPGEHLGEVAQRVSGPLRIRRCRGVSLHTRPFVCNSTLSH